jgi:hypothetical protein
VGYLALETVPGSSAQLRSPVHEGTVLPPKWAPPTRGLSGTAAVPDRPGGAGNKPCPYSANQQPPCTADDCLTVHESYTTSKCSHRRSRHVRWPSGMAFTITFAPRYKRYLTASTVSACACSPQRHILQTLPTCHIAWPKPRHMHLVFHSVHSQHSSPHTESMMASEMIVVVCTASSWQ